MASLPDLSEIRERYNSALASDRENREAYESDLKFLAGEQWEYNTKRQREAQGRPVLTINKLPQFVRQVANDIKLNRPQIKVRGIDDNTDQKKAEVFTGLIRAIEKTPETQNAYDTAIDSLVACGVGSWRIVNTYVSDSSFDQRLEIRRIANPLSVVWDGDAEDFFYSDAKFCFVTSWIPRKQFERDYPGRSISSFDDTGAWVRSDGAGQEHVRLAEYWVKEEYPRTLARLHDGNVLDITEYEKDRNLMELLAPQIKETSKRHAQKIKQYFVSGREVLSDPVEWPGKNIPIVTVRGEEVNVKDKTIRSGIVRYAKDSQRLLNHARSMGVEYFSMLLKAPILATPDHLRGYERQWAAITHTAQPYLLFNPSPENNTPSPRRLDTPSTMPGVLEQLGLSTDEMKQTTGIYDAALGSRSNEVSGRAILARQKEADTSVYTYARNFRSALQHTGKLLIDLIPKFYSTERVVRVLDKRDTFSTARINFSSSEGEVENDLSVGEYDVMVDVGPSYATRRDETVNYLSQIVQANPALATVLLPILLKHMDFEGAEEVGELLAQLQQQQAAPPLSLKEQARAESARADARLKSAKAEGQEIENAANVLTFNHLEEKEISDVTNT